MRCTMAAGKSKRSVVGAWVFRFDACGCRAEYYNSDMENSGPYY